MTYEDSGPCPNYEDIEYLAQCATSGDFSMLIDGVIRPEFMSEQGKLIAEWIIARRYEPHAEWPPSYATLKHTFEYVHWPDIPPDLRGLDPSFPAFALLHSYKQWHIMHMRGTLTQLLTVDFEDELFDYLKRRLQDNLYTLQTLGTAEKRPMRLGEDPEGMMDRILGAGLKRSMAEFRMDLDIFNEINEPYTPGLYVVFGRPKSMKSWRAERAAKAYTIDQGFRGLVVDPENDLRTLETRMACIEGGLDGLRVKDVQKKYQRNKRLLPEEERIMDELSSSVARIHQHSNLFLIGKDSKPKGEMYITLEYIFRMMEEMECDVLYAEQIHKIISPQWTRRNDGEYTVVRKISQLLADSPYIVIATTQEKRQNNPPKVPTLKMPIADMVFGGDGVAQNCAFLAHVTKWDLDLEGTALQRITPLLARNGVISSDPLWLRTRQCLFEEVLDPSYGRAMAEAVILAEKQKDEKAKNKAKEIVKDNMQIAAQRDQDRLKPVGKSRVLTAWNQQRTHDPNDSSSEG